MTDNKKPLDGLLDEAQALSDTGKVHADIKLSDYGVAIVVRDAEPEDCETTDGDLVTHYPGQIITAGNGANITEAVAAANAGMKSRAGATQSVDPSKPNHYVYDSLGDPATCTEDHNHPEPDDEPAINAVIREGN